MEVHQVVEIIILPEVSKPPEPILTKPPLSFKFKVPTVVEVPFAIIESLSINKWMVVSESPTLIAGLERDV